MTIWKLNSDEQLKDEEDSEVHKRGKSATSSEKPKTKLAIEENKFLVKLLEKKDLKNQELENENKNLKSQIQ